MNLCPKIKGELEVKGTCGHVAIKTKWTTFKIYNTVTYTGAIKHFITDTASACVHVLGPN